MRLLSLFGWSFLFLVFSFLCSGCGDGDEAVSIDNGLEVTINGSRVTSEFTLANVFPQGQETSQLAINATSGLNTSSQSSILINLFFDREGGLEAREFRSQAGGCPPIDLRDCVNLSYVVGQTAYGEMEGTTRITIVDNGDESGERVSGRFSGHLVNANDRDDVLEVSGEFRVVIL